MKQFINYGLQKSINLIDVIYGWMIKLRFGRCGKRLRLHRRGNMLISPENIKIGDNFRCMGWLKMYGNDGHIEIGDNNSFNTNVQIGSSQGDIKIGNDVLIGPNVVIRSANHNYSDKNELIRLQGHKRGSIVIEDDVWIGANVVILKDVVIKKGTVIAAGSVVTDNTESYSLVGGIPAKFLSSRGANQ